MRRQVSLPATTTAILSSTSRTHNDRARSYNNKSSLIHSPPINNDNDNLKERQSITTTNNKSISIGNCKAIARRSLSQGSRASSIKNSDSNSSSSSSLGTVATAPNAATYKLSRSTFDDMDTLDRDTIVSFGFGSGGDGGDDPLDQSPTTTWTATKYLLCWPCHLDNDNDNYVTSNNIDTKQYRNQLNSALTTIESPRSSKRRTLRQRQQANQNNPIHIIRDRSCFLNSIAGRDSYLVREFRSFKRGLRFDEARRRERLATMNQQQRRQRQLRAKNQQNHNQQEQVNQQSIEMGVNEVNNVSNFKTIPKRVAVSGLKRLIGVQRSSGTNSKRTKARKATSNNLDQGNKERSFLDRCRTDSNVQIIPTSCIKQSSSCGANIKSNLLDRRRLKNRSLKSNSTTESTEITIISNLNGISSSTANASINSKTSLTKSYNIQQQQKQPSSSKSQSSPCNQSFNANTTNTATLMMTTMTSNVNGKQATFASAASNSRVTRSSNSSSSINNDDRDLIDEEEQEDEEEFESAQDKIASGKRMSSATIEMDRDIISNENNNSNNNNRHKRVQISRQDQVELEMDANYMDDRDDDDDDSNGMDDEDYDELEDDIDDDEDDEQDDEDDDDYNILFGSAHNSPERKPNKIRTNEINLEDFSLKNKTILRNNQNLNSTLIATSTNSATTATTTSKIAQNNNNNNIINNHSNSQFVELGQDNKNGCIGSNQSSFKRRAANMVSSRHIGESIVASGSSLVEVVMRGLRSVHNIVPISQKPIASPATATNIANLSGPKLPKSAASLDSAQPTSSNFTQSSTYNNNKNIALNIYMELPIICNSNNNNNDDDDNNNNDRHQTERNPEKLQQKQQQQNSTIIMDSVDHGHEIKLVSYRSGDKIESDMPSSADPSLLSDYANIKQEEDLHRGLHRGSRSHRRDSSRRDSNQSNLNTRCEANIGSNYTNSKIADDYLDDDSNRRQLTLASMGKQNGEKPAAEIAVSTEGITPTSTLR